MRIVKLYANEWEEAGVDGGAPVYEDIYSDPAACLADHPGAKVMEGYGVARDDSPLLVDESDDFYYTEAEAQAFIDANQ